MTEDVKIYFQNKETCNRICEIAGKAYHFITSQIKIAGDKFGLRCEGKDDKDYRYLYDTEVTGVYYTVFFEKVWEKKQKILIIIELWKEGLTFLPEQNEEAKRQALDDGLTLSDKTHPDLWKHFAF